MAERKPVEVTVGKDTPVVLHISKSRGAGSGAGAMTAGSVPSRPQGPQVAAKSTAACGSKVGSRAVSARQREPFYPSPCRSAHGKRTLRQGDAGGSVWETATLSAGDAMQDVKDLGAKVHFYKDHVDTLTHTVDKLRYG